MCLVLLVSVLLVPTFVTATPFPVPGRPLQSQHKQMRVYNASNAQTQGQLFTATNADATSFTLSDGDTVTCIPIEKQPSLSPFDNPEIQLKPSMHPYSGSSSSYDNGAKTASQLFAKEYKKCPKGQIPVRKNRQSDLDAAGELSTSSPKRKYVHQHAYTATTISHPPAYKGTQVVLNVWQPFVEAHDFSLAQLWVMNTGLSFNPGSSNWLMNSIEVGWQVYSDLYGDKLARLFVYWTGDGYVSTGCYNLNQDCPTGSAGFVQVSSKVLLGGSISPPSEADSDQYEIKLRVFKDDESGNWWLQYNQENVGYWPRSLFHSLRDSSDLIQWGGEVFDVREGDAQTKTYMGSGALATSGFGKAAYQRNLQYVSLGNTMNDVTDLQNVTTAPSCFTVSPGNNQDWGTYFYYGGRC